MFGKNKKNTIQLLFSGIIILSIVLSGCQTATEEPTAAEPTEEEVVVEEPTEEEAEEEPAEKPYEGITLNIFMETVPDTQYVKEFIPEFEEQTGMDVQVEELSYSVMHEKLIPQLTTGEGSGAYDVIVVDKQWVGEFVCAEWLLPLDDYIAQDDFDTSVYTPAMFNMIGEVGGTVYTLPFYNYSTGLAYRNDIFTDSDIKSEYQSEFDEEMQIPEKLDEYIRLAKFLTVDQDGDGEVDRYGVAGQLQRLGAYWEYSMLLFALDSWYYDQDWNAIVNTETGVQALEHLIDLYENAMPEAATGYTFEEKLSMGTQGKAAMMLTYSWMPSLLNNPENSAVPGEWEFTIAPGGHGAQGGWGWAIPKSAPNPDAAWEFLSYIESFEVAKGRAMLGGQPVRDDVFNDPEVLEEWPSLEVTQEIVAKAKPFPVLCNSAQVNEAIGLHVSQALTGDVEPQKAMDDLAKELNEIVEGDPLAK
jgi:ABC-type glycerol-3-phosphate transport system substrate-binding protein